MSQARRAASDATTVKHGWQILNRDNQPSDVARGYWMRDGGGTWPENGRRQISTADSAEIETDTAHSELSSDERCDVVLAAAGGLHENGQETGATLLAIKRLSIRLGVSGSLRATWDELHLHLRDGRVRSLAAVLRLPFAAVGFASVVSMMPAIYLLRMSSSLVEVSKAGRAASTSLVAGIVSDGTIVIMNVCAMALGLLLPLRLYGLAKGMAEREP